MLSAFLLFVFFENFGIDLDELYCNYLTNEEQCKREISCMWGNGNLCHKDACFQTGQPKDTLTCESGCNMTWFTDSTTEEVISNGLCYNETYHPDSSNGGPGSCSAYNWLLWDGNCTNTSKCSRFADEACLESVTTRNVTVESLCNSLVNENTCKHEIACRWVDGMCTRDLECFHSGHSFFMCPTGCGNYTDGDYMDPSKPLFIACYNTSYHRTVNCSVMWWAKWGGYCDISSSYSCTRFGIGCLETNSNDPPPPTTSPVWNEISDIVICSVVIVAVIVVLTVFFVIFFGIRHLKLLCFKAPKPPETIPASPETIPASPEVFTGQVVRGQGPSQEHSQEYSQEHEPKFQYSPHQQYPPGSVGTCNHNYGYAPFHVQDPSQYSSHAWMLPTTPSVAYGDECKLTTLPEDRW